MSFLGRLGWTKDTNEMARGQYAFVKESEDLVSKECPDLSSLQEQHRALLESHRQLKRRLRWLCIGFGLLFVVLVTAMFYAKKTSAVAKIRSPVPEMPRTLVIFEQNDTFAGPSTQENDEAWSAMMPAGDGFIIVDSPGKYNLPPGKSTKHGEVYDISLFHQLHCLAHIRNHYYLTQSTLHSNNSQRIEEMLLKPQEDHVHHCFDYIRQGIMCTGDMTLEWPRTENDGRRFAVDGWGVTHECKSWDAIMEFMGENDVASKIWTG